MTEQIDALVEKPPGKMSQSPPTVPGFCDPWPILHPNLPGNKLLPTPSPAEFAELREYNRAFARRPSEDSPVYSPPFPGRGSREAFMMASRLRGQQHGGEADPDYARAAVLYGEREQVRSMIPPLCERFRALSGQIEAQEPSVAPHVPVWHLPEEERRNAFFGWG